MKYPIPAGADHLLLVEGPSDMYVIRKLLEHLQLESEFHVIPSEGKSKLANEISNVLNDDNFSKLSSIGIICDNDYPDDRQGKSGFDVVVDHIAEANREVVNSKNESRQFPIPTQPRRPSTKSPNVSILLLPSDEGDGAFEDLVLEAIGYDKVMQCVGEYLECLKTQGVKARTPRVAKSKLSIYISGKVLDKDFAKHEDTKRWFLSQAVDMKWWQEEDLWNRPAFDDAKAFLKQLLDD